MKFKPIKSEKELNAIADEFFREVRKIERQERREQLRGPILTTTIKRPWFADIVAGFKKIEYREMTPYWDRRLDGLFPPFNLQLINGMLKKPPKLIVRVLKVKANKKTKQYELHLGKVLDVKNWDMKKSVVDTLSVIGRRDMKVVEYTMEYILFYKTKPALRLRKSAAPPANIKKLDRKINEFIKKIDQ